MSETGWFHMYFALASIGSGTVVVLRRKGTSSHRWLGYVYAVSMLGLNVTALMIYRLTGSFGPFHVAAIVSLAGVLWGVAVAIKRGPQWVRLHYKLMTWSYVGLLAATASEILTRMESAPFWGAVLAATLAVVFVGAWLIRKYENQSVARFASARNAPRMPLLLRRSVRSPS